MASWSGVEALSGFEYDGPHAAVVAVPRVPHEKFQCFWSTGTGWGTFSYGIAGANGVRLNIKVLAGKLPCQSIEMTGAGAVTSAIRDGQTHAHTVQQNDGRTAFRLKELLALAEGQELSLEVHA
jgi:hypothetical protein